MLSLHFQANKIQLKWKVDLLLFCFIRWQFLAFCWLPTKPIICEIRQTFWLPFVDTHTRARMQTPSYSQTYSTQSQLLMEFKTQFSMEYLRILVGIDAIWMMFGEANTFYYCLAVAIIFLFFLLISTWCVLFHVLFFTLSFSLSLHLFISSVWFGCKCKNIIIVATLYLFHNMICIGLF